MLNLQKITTCAKLTVSIFCLVQILGCNAGKDQPNIELVQQMMDQESLKAQDYDAATNTPAARLPPEGTVPRGFKPYAYPTDPVQAENQLINPFAGDFSPEVLSIGKKHYEIYCMVCHGQKGLGDGIVADKFMGRKPPTLMSDLIRGYKDGRIFHIITVGQGVMGSYAVQMRDENDRWAVVNYIRSLQKASK